MEEILQQIYGLLETLPDSLASAKDALLETFGTPGLIAIVILFLSVAVLLVMKITKMTFDVIRYVAVPSVVISFLATYFLPYSFVFVLPLAVSFFSLVLIVKG
jgi:hypothetical protein